MNKKLIGLFIIFFAVVLAIGSVNAANLKNHNFEDNLFSMDIPKGVHFEKERNVTHENGLDEIVLTYYSDELLILYMDTPVITENSSAFLYQSFFESMYPELSECYESQEGNLTIIEPETTDELYYPLVGTNSGNEMVLIAGKDLDLIKEMGESVDFN